MRTRRTTGDVLALVLLVLGGAAIAAVALRSGDDRLTQVLACIALGALAHGAVVRFRGRERAPRERP